MDLALILTLDAAAKRPLHRQLYEQIRQAILSGKLRSHTQLPATRQLAQILGISRTTVTQSYDQLISEGYLQTRQGAGTFVSEHLPEDLLNTRPIGGHLSRGDLSSGPLKPEQGPACAEQKNRKSKKTSETSANRAQATEHPQPLPLSTYGQHLQQLPARTFELGPLLSFRYGIPDLSQFPVQRWRRLLNKHQAKGHDWMGYSPEPMGYRPLREQIAQYITQARAVRCSPEQILITQGAQQALGLIARLLVTPGEAIALEDPGYLSGQHVFQANGAQIQPVPVDSEGLKVEGPNGLDAIATPKTRLVYVTPSHQFPTGVLMSLPRRLALLQWAQRQNALIVEDDYDSEFRYSGRPIPALQGLETACNAEARVIYVGTFSKILFPGLQIGYVVVPQSLISVFRQAKWLCDRQCSWLNQVALADFIAEGELARHIRRMRPVYHRRRQTLITQLQQTDSSMRVSGDPAGLHIMATLPKVHDAQTLIAQARSKGVGLFSAEPHYWPVDSASRPSTSRPSALPNEVKSTFIFGFGGLDEPAIEEAIARISPLIRSAQ
ncbi:MAG: PLP-dependent aminotransferase family protein [Cyanobacteria bacterium J06597_16]